jgi:diguanylate cyclase (GGDEF)-like protein
MTTREEIDKTIEDLRRLIEQAVRNEQLRHQLTGLPNAPALAGHLQSAMESAIGRDEQFWLGFIEIDRFKSINDQFGYERADILLLEVARMIEQTASRFFAGQAVAFHAHGDEFYVLGFVHPIAFTTQDITDKLGAIRGAIASIALPAGSGAGLIKCTVSIGWTISLAATASELMHEVEIAVAHAKRRGRNRIEMYDESMRKAPVVSLRSECSRCETSFSFEIPTAALRDGDAFCPNCGTQGPRPAHAARAPAPQDITDLPPAPPRPA